MSDDAHGVDVFLDSLEAPFQQLVHNHGLVHPPVAMETVTRLGCGYGFDVRSGAFVDMWRAGILDSLHVAQGALQLATSTAISMLTTGAVVLTAKVSQAPRVRA
jgi:chaperonin GroEL